MQRRRLMLLLYYRISGLYIISRVALTISPPVDAAFHHGIASRLLSFLRKP